jgi:hypothetical protein
MTDTEPTGADLDQIEGERFVGTVADQDFIANARKDVPPVVREVGVAA